MDATLPRSVTRRLAALAREHALDGSTVAALAALLAALAAEPSPPTTVVEPAEAVDTHVADSLSGLALPTLLEAVRVADIGAGAGFPGLVLAAALPAVRVDLIEATGRKCEVIDRLAAAAGLTNAAAVNARAEEVAKRAPGIYDIVTARAVAPLAVLAEYAAPLLCPEGELIAWKGRLERDELDDGAAAAEQLGLAPPVVTGVRPFPAARDRVLVSLRKIAPTPERFPRRPGVAVKRPLKRSVRP